MISGRKAFTLIEIMVAGAISALVITAVISGFMGTVESKEAFEEARDISHTAYMILERFRLEMGSAYLSNLGNPMCGMTFDACGEFSSRRIGPVSMITFHIGFINALMASATSFLDVGRVNGRAFIIHSKFHVRGMAIGTYRTYC